MLIQAACFVAHSCSHTWAKLDCVNEEVSASLWGISPPGQQVHGSLTCSLHQLCASMCASACVRPCFCVCEHVETNWQATSRALGKLAACWTLVNSEKKKKRNACCCLSRRRFPGETLKSCLLCSWLLEAKWAGFTSKSASAVEKRERKEGGPLDWQRLSYCIIRPGF